MPSSDAATIRRTAWLLIHDTTFLRANSVVRPEVFPAGTLRWLIKSSIENYQTNHVPFNRGAAEMLADFDARAVTTDVLRIYDALDKYAMTETEAAAIRPIARAWLERRQMEVVSERALDMARAGNISGAKDILTQTNLKNLDDVRVLSLSPTTADFMAVLKIPTKGFIPTGWAELDDLWEGGVRPGEVGLVLAPTGVGKSMALSYFAASAFWHGGVLCGTCGKRRDGHGEKYTDKNGNKKRRHAFVSTRMDILYYTFELTEDQIRDRIALAILRKGKDDVHGTWADEVAAIAALEKRPVPDAYLEVKMETGMSWNDLAFDLEEYKRLNGKYPDLLLLDSADDLAPIRNRDSGHQELKEAFVFLRQLMHDTRIRCWTSGQLNRESIEKARVNLKMIGDAFAKAQKVHYVIGFAQTNEHKNHVNGPFVQMYVLKDSTHGTTGGWLETKVNFGVGSNGYAGFEIEHTHNLPILAGGMTTTGGL